MSVGVETKLKTLVTVTVAVHITIQLKTLYHLVMASQEKISLSGKVILITGASSGIGAGAALHFASCGSR